MRIRRNLESLSFLFLQMLSDGYSFLDQVIEIFRNVWSEAFCFQNSQNLVASDKPYLCNTKLISELNTNFGWCKPLLCILVYLLLNIFRRLLQPCWNTSSVWKSTLGYTLPGCVHTTHDAGSDFRRIHDRPH